LTFEERLHREIDQENTTEESKRLREEFERRPETRAQYEELLRLLRTLEAVRAAEPPASLAADIMRAVRARALPSRLRTSWSEAIRSALARQPALGLGAALAAGLVLGAFLVGIGEPKHLDEKSGGTMLPADRLALREVDRAVLVGDGFRGEAVVVVVAGWIEVRVHLEGPPPLELLATFDGRDLEPLGFDRQGAPAGQVVLGPDSLHVLEAGAGDYVLRLAIRKTVASRVQIRLGRGPAGVERALKVTEGS